ncbi:MAG: hypothetical protein HY558_02490 [Euryarchaeota archaeon]|nr:hypothetical protein [Euryarchaeota archaeon]
MSPQSALVPLLSPREAEEVFRAGGDSICVSCKGAHLLCGKERCPILVKTYIQRQTAPLLDRLDLSGASPPGIFVGRYGYPKVSVGPLVPPVSGDTAHMDIPEGWLGRSIEEIVGFRFSLVRGKHRVDAYNVEGAGRLVDQTRELAMAAEPADIEARFSRKPAGRILLSDEIQPFGPSAPLEKFDVDNVKVERRIERAYGDRDLKARGAVLGLYRDGLRVSQIQRAFSAGLFGLGRNRHFVPTRWSITAVDSAIGIEMVKRIRDHPILNEFLLFEAGNLDNRFLVLMMPFEWSYELIEAWYPNTIWNPIGQRTVILASHEFYEGRTTYAEIGGCYYAARLAVGEYLTRVRRQAKVVILREAHPGYIMPVGVWNVRETVREALRLPPRRFDTLRETLAHIQTKLDIPMDTWIAKSAVLTDHLRQRRLTEYAAIQE